VRLGPQAVVAIAGLLGMTAAAALASDWIRQRGAVTGGASDPPADQECRDPTT
jgi:hypothetical protein